MTRKLMALLTALLMTLTMLAPAALGEGEFPELNENGFYDGGEFVFADAENGVWRYCSDTLKVEIIRYTQASPSPQIWYEAEIWSTEDEALSMVAANPDKRMKTQLYPYEIARKWGTVVAVNGDFAHLRISQNKRVGILLRQGEIISSKTLAHNKGSFPNLDNLVLYQDGDMEVYWSDEHTAKEYVEMGAMDVLAFGPVLIRDGMLNTEALEKYGSSHAPRTAVGMVEKGHYFLMMLEGRHTKSTGEGITFLADQLSARDCVLAFNLDGGDSAGMIFMGEQISRVGDGTNASTKSCRRASEILGIGTSSLVPAYQK